LSDSASYDSVVFFQATLGQSAQPKLELDEGQIYRTRYDSFLPRDAKQSAIMHCANLAKFSEARTYSCNDTQQLLYRYHLCDF